MVVFKRLVTGPDNASKSFRLVLLLIHENPASGIHAGALANAIGLVMRWNNLVGTSNSEGPCTVRLLGPTFSGSSETLNQALQMVSRRLERTQERTRRGDEQCRDYRVRIVSGSATDPRNKQIIESGFAEDDTEEPNTPGSFANRLTPVFQRTVARLTSEQPGTKTTWDGGAY